MHQALKLLVLVGAVNASPFFSKTPTVLVPKEPAPAGCTPIRDARFGLDIAVLAVAQKRGQIGDPVSQIPDSQPQAPSAPTHYPVTQISDGQPQAPNYPPSAPPKGPPGPPGSPSPPGTTLTKTITDPDSTADTVTVTLFCPESSTGEEECIATAHPTPDSDPTSELVIITTVTCSEGVDSHGCKPTPPPTPDPKPETTPGDPTATITVSKTTDPASGSNPPVTVTPKTRLVTEIYDGQPQAPTDAVTHIVVSIPQYPVTQINDGQVQDPPKPTQPGVPVSQISDGQIQATTKAPKIYARDVMGKDHAISRKRGDYCKDGTLLMTLKDGILTDAKDRTGYIASNFQFQFDNPPQHNALFTGGFSVCDDNTLALGANKVWYRCKSGDFYNLYDRNWAYQCEPVHFQIIDLSKC